MLKTGINGRKNYSRPIKDLHGRRGTEKASWPLVEESLLSGVQMADIPHNQPVQLNLNTEVTHLEKWLRRVCKNNRDKPGVVDPDLYWICMQQLCGSRSVFRTRIWIHTIENRKKTLLQLIWIHNTEGQVLPDKNTQDKVTSTIPFPNEIKKNILTELHPSIVTRGHTYSLSSYFQPFCEKIIHIKLISSPLD